MIREAAAGDAGAIEALLVEAFEGRGEADLVAALQGAGDLALELVAEIDGAPVGHAAFPRLASGAGLSLAALAPLSVAAAHRRAGLGEALVRAGLDRLAALGVDWCLALGDPAYYGRFGFSAEAATGFATPYDGPHQQALALRPDAGAAAGAVAYPPAFAGL